MKTWLGTTLASLAMIAVTVAGLAAQAAVDRSGIDADVRSTLDSFYTQHPRNRELVDKAAAVLVFPRISKAGLGVGGEYGHGALMVNGSIAGYYKVSGASVGATIGVARSSEVILFMTSAARDKFLHSNGWTLGADVGVAVASAGAGGDYDNETLQRPVVAFVFGEHGLIGDVSVQGTKITKLER